MSLTDFGFGIDPLIKSHTTDISNMNTSISRGRPAGTIKNRIIQKRCRVCKKIMSCVIYINKKSNVCIQCQQKKRQKYYTENRDWILENSFLYGSRWGKKKIFKNRKRIDVGFLSADITGICAICGEILIFGEIHHVFGNSRGFTLMLCCECHNGDISVSNLDYHCLSIGQRIEWGALCYPSTN